MTSSDPEQALTTLGLNWPGSSVAPAVMAKLASEPESLKITPRSSWRSSWWTVPGVAVAATMAWLCLFQSPPDLQAQLLGAIQSAKSVALKITATDDDGASTVAEIWYSREHGCRAVSPDSILFDNGRDLWTWSPATAEAGETIVIQRNGGTAMTMIGECLQLDPQSPDMRPKRAPDLDRELRGQKCQAFVVGFPQSASAADDKPIPGVPRIVVFIDSDQRVLRIEEHRAPAVSWKLRREIDITYNVEIPLERFSANYPPDAKIVRADTLLEGRFPLEKALVTKESGGLLFAVHEAQPLEDGLLYVVSSVRGTPGYLKQYPPRSRKLNLTTTVLDVVEQPAAATTDHDLHRAILAVADDRGVHYVWWIAVPRVYFQTKGQEKIPAGNGPALIAADGGVRLPLKAISRMGTPPNWIEAVMEFSTSIKNRLTLEEIAARVRRDGRPLTVAGGAYCLFGWKADGEMAYLPATVTAAELARHTKQQIEWLRTSDAVSDVTLRGAPGLGPVDGK